ncbi:hypothetical protein ACWFPY_24525 [Nocardia fluminea]
MNRLLLGLVATALAAALIGVTASLLADHDNHSPTASSHPAGDSHIQGPAPDDADASTAARMGLAAMFSWQPRTDASPGAALTRAQPWLTGELAATATGAFATRLGPLPEWAGWRDSSDIVTALIEAEQPKTDIAEATVAASVTQQVLHRDGSATLYRRLHVTATVTETSQGWRMSSYRINSVTGHG